MAKKSKRVEKETRKLMESVGDLVKKHDGHYRIKGKKKKKILKKMRVTCVHWIYRKGKEVPTVIHDPDNAGNWKCTICGASFPVKPLDDVEVNGHTINGYKYHTDQMIQLVNQMQFWAVKLGGDKEDTKMFLMLRKVLPRFNAASKQILKNVRKREALENNPDKANAMNMFDNYSSFNYRA